MLRVASTRAVCVMQLVAHNKTLLSVFQVGILYRNVDNVLRIHAYGYSSRKMFYNNDNPV